MRQTLLVFFLLAGTMSGQKTAKTLAWKEYVYASDGFAAKFPYAPEPHTDATNPDFKVWTIQLGHGAAISIRLKRDSQPCDVALGKLKSMTASNHIEIREFTVSGRPAWEEKDWARGNGMVFERYVCGEGRYYILTLSWPTGDPRPQGGVDIMDSFRLVKGSEFAR
jgi:hypothetical protein